MSNKCNRCGQVFRNEKAVSSHVKNKHASYYYGVRIIPAVIVIGAIITFLYFFGNTTPLSNDTNTPTENIFDLAFPVVDQKGLTGENLRLGDLGGQPMVLEFMLSWCEYCKAMAPVVEEVYSEYGASTIFLTVAGSRSGATVESTAEFMQEFGSTFVHIFDEQNIIFDNFGISGTPTYLFFNSDGSLSNTISGEMPKSELISAINLLN